MTLLDRLWQLDPQAAAKVSVEDRGRARVHAYRERKKATT